MHLGSRSWWNWKSLCHDILLLGGHLVFCYFVAIKRAHAIVMALLRS